MCLRCVNCFAFTMQSISMQFITQWFFFLKILRSFISIQIPGVALNWYFLKLSLWLSNEPYACAQNIESMNQQKNKKIQLQYIVVCINKILRQHLIKLHNFFLLLNTKKDVSLFLFWQCTLIWSSASLWQMMNHNNNKKVTFQCI